MGRNPIKENQNPYFRARKQAAEWDARLESRERASELIGIAAYTLADYELGNVKRVPADKVLIMADLYNAPWLLSNYCNNNYGSDHGYPHEKGTPTYYDNNKIGRVATGSGPDTWSHNWMPDGIFDLNGNVWEWCAGLRLVDGEIQIIPYANSMILTTSMAAGSTEWKAIAADGSLVAPGTAGTLKWDWISGKFQLTNGDVTYKTDQGNGCQYKDMTLVSGLTAPELAKALLLYPDEPNGDYGNDYHWANLTGERLPRCGGAWSNTSLAGVFFVGLDGPRSGARGYIGFRSAFVN